MITALEFGSRHRSCSEAMEWRRSLPADATQADAWLACERGDWLLWQLSHGLTSKQYDAVRPSIKRALDRITERAVLRAHLACVDAGIEIPKWEVWAFDFVTNPASEWSTASAAMLAVESAWSSESAASSAAAWSASSAASSAAESAAASEWSAAAASSWASAAAAAWSAESAAESASEAAASAWSSSAAASSAARARAAERLAQAEDIRAEIPAWIWEEVPR